MTKTSTPSELIDNQIAQLTDWRGRMFTRLRKLILAADPEIKEEWKWETAVWTRAGMVCAVGGFKDHLKVNFFRGASLKDPHNLFNAGLDAKKTRAIDLYEGDKLNEKALTELICEAVGSNLGAK
jgi:hypothetical protein